MKKPVDVKAEIDEEREIALCRAQHPATEIRELHAKVAQLEAQLAAATEGLATFMLEHSFATGHGDTHADLLAELGPQIKQLRSQLAEAIEALKPFAAAAECVPDADCERARTVMEKHK